MQEEATIEVTEEVTPEQDTEVTPPVEETQVTPPTEEIKEEVKETEKPFIEGLSYKTPEDLIKGVQEKDTTIAKISQELKELKEKQEIKQYEQTKATVETGNVQLKQEYQTILSNLQAGKSQLRAEALANYNETGDQTAYDYALQSIDAQFDQAKGQLDFNYRNVETQLTQQQKELLNLTKQRNLADFQAKNADFCEKYKPVIDKYIELGYDPQDLPAVKQLLEVALSTEAGKTNLLNENNEAKGKLVSTAFNNVSTPAEDQIPTTWNAIVDKMDKNPEWYQKNLAKITQMRDEGLIK